MTRHSPALALSVLCAAACADVPHADSPPHAGRLYDSAGVRIAENPRPPAGSRLGWEIGPEPTLTIGAANGEAPYRFDRVGMAATLPDGSIVVAEGWSNEVRKFDAEGGHLASWGEYGTGPGEFDELYGVARWRGDSIAAWDRFPYRGVAIFDAEGNLGRMVALGMGGPDRSISILRGGSFLADHWIHDHGLHGDDESELMVQEQVFEIRDADGARTASLAALPGREFFHFDNRGMPVEMDVAFSRSVHAAAWRELALVSPDHRYELRAYAADGALRRIVRVHHAPVPVTDSLVELAREQWGARDRFDGMPLPETLPAFATVMADALDHLWVREYPVPGRETPAPVWTVFDPEGRVLGFVETPPRLLVYEIGADYVLGRWFGEPGVAQVQVWPLRR
ncbi:MAG: hypothetical protein OXQ94_09775 [Gemmatimonadota bacterium]|nr:hypothetical protein [Gemmatimonadota bacterium]MDE2871956.1 hypothetical protein [Gemmatimonadota bacterium]